MLDQLILWDQWLFECINQSWQHPWLDQLLPYWRNKRTWIPLYILLLIVIGKDRKGKTFWVLLLLGLTIALADQVSSQWIKKGIMRLRPCNDPNINVRLLLEHCGSGFSFTSSHATNHFAIATQLVLIFRLSWSRWIVLLWFLWAALIAYSQVYVGVHYPLDVLVGALLGISLAYLVHKIGGALGIVRQIWME